MKRQRLLFPPTTTSKKNADEKRNPLRVPVTQGLKDIYAMDMHTAYQAACLGQFNVVAFGRLAAAMSVIRSALEQKQTKIPLAIETLDAAIETLVAVRKRGDETNEWELTESERPSILDGIDMADAVYRNAGCRAAGADCGQAAR